MSGGLRERKRARTRAHIAATAARLFAERGYEHTAVAEVARAAEVSEQTVYNYFPVKHDLVVDRDAEIRGGFASAVRDRPPGTSPARAVLPFVLELAEQVRTTSPVELRGSLGHLSLSSPAVHRLALEATERVAEDVAGALVATTEPPPDPALAKLQGIALAWLAQTVLDETGRMVRDGHGPGEIADRLRGVLVAAADRLDAGWPA